MELTEFKYRLEASTKKLIEFTDSMVTNSISRNVEYLIEPNCPESSDHLNERELNKLAELNGIKGKVFNSHDACNMLHVCGLVPLWINTEVFRSKKNMTTIKLICSRRLRNERELNYKADEFPPFHPGVPLPPWKRENVKFNINWKHQKLKGKLLALTWKWRYKQELKRTTS